MFKKGDVVTSKSWQPVLDEGEHHRAQLGFILMSTDLAGESDFIRMAPDGVGIHVTRLKTEDYKCPRWFAPDGVTPEYRYSFGRQNWFNFALEEQKTAREGVAMIDDTMLGKLMVGGAGAESFLQRICANNMAMASGRVAYALMLNKRGGIESDVTVVRHAEDAFMVMNSISHNRRGYLRLKGHIQPGEDVRLRDVTSSYAVLAIMAPKSRDMLSEVSDVDLSNAAFPFNSHRTFYIGHAKVTDQRLSYSGELGWEIFVMPDFAEHVFDVLMAAGKNYGLCLIGGEALNALRIEKGFLHWGHDIAYTEAPTRWGSNLSARRPFIGRDSYLARAAKNKGPFLCSIKLRDPEPLLHHNEPVLLHGEVAGYVTTGAYGYVIGSAVGLCLLSLPEEKANEQMIEEGDYTVMVEGREIAADVGLTPFYDPWSKRMIT